MSQVNIQGLVATIKDTTVYTALVEAVNNSIQSIEATGRKDGKIIIELLREKQSLGLLVEDDDEESRLPAITSIRITDNGEGFNDKNIESFDEAYTQHKVAVGGKGFGRFVYLKHFIDAKITSTYRDGDGTLKRREFLIGKVNDIVYDLKESVDEDSKDTSTRLELITTTDKNLDKRTSTVARKLLEKILVHFTRADFTMPRIVVVDDYTGEDDIVLNDLLGDDSYAEIQRLESDEFELLAGRSYRFNVHIFKVWFPGAQQSRIALASHNLEVTEVPLADYINEFESGFVGKFENSRGATSNRFILKVYVTGDYLNEKVDRERVSFSFGKKPDIYNPIGRAQIELGAANVIKKRFSKQFSTERTKKSEKMAAVTNARQWLKKYETRVDLASLKVGASEEEYEVALEVARIKEGQEISLSVQKLMSSDTQVLTEQLAEKIILQVTDSNREDLARYVARRKAVLDIFDKSLKSNKSGKHSTEKVMHDIIYPTKHDSDSEAIDHFQNLWILDERLNFTEYISSDKKLGDSNTSRPDLYAFHHQVAFRAGDDQQNPITIVEFKKPGRDNFASRGNKENPVDQIVRYTNDIRDGRYTAPGKRPIHTDTNTQFYGYIIVEFTEKVKRWLRVEEDFIPMPDGLGYFKTFANTNLYVEVLSWDKVLKDAQLRNRIFIEKLGL